MAHPNALLIDRFYQAFQKLDAEAMAACYAEQVQFSKDRLTDRTKTEVAAARKAIGREFMVGNSNLNMQIF